MPDESGIKFLAPHFYELSESELDSLSFCVAEGVVSDPSLVLKAPREWASSVHFTSGIR
jgi:hypothetical protein